MREYERLMIGSKHLSLIFMKDWLQNSLGIEVLSLMT